MEKNDRDLKLRHPSAALAYRRMQHYWKPALTLANTRLPLKTRAHSPAHHRSGLVLEETLQRLATTTKNHQGRRGLKTTIRSKPFQNCQLPRDTETETETESEKCIRIHSVHGKKLPFTATRGYPLAFESASNQILLDGPASRPANCLGQQLLHQLCKPSNNHGPRSQTNFRRVQGNFFEE